MMIVSDQMILTYDFIKATDKLQEIQWSLCCARGKQAEARGESLLDSGSAGSSPARYPLPAVLCRTPHKASVQYLTAL